MSAHSISRKSPWLSVVNSMDPAEPTEIHVSGFIGETFWDDSGTSARQFTETLNEIPKGKRVNIKVSSEGGIIKDALEIYNAVEERSADIQTHIIGYAASAASWAFLPANRVFTADSAIWMIHSASAFTAGNAEDHEKAARMLGKHDDAIAGILAKHTGKTADAIKADMQKETWFSGAEAKDYGLAHELYSDKESKNSVSLNSAPWMARLPDRFRAASNVGTPIQATAPAECKPTTDAANSSSAIVVEDSTAGHAAGTTERKHTMPEQATAATEAVELNSLREQLKQEKRARLTNVVNGYVSQNRIAAESVDFYVNSAMNDEASTLKALNATKPIQAQGAEPLRSSVSVENEGEMDRISRMATPAERYAAMKNSWEGIINHAQAHRGDSHKFVNRYAPKDIHGNPLPQNSNSLDAAITTNFLLDGAVTKLQNRWAPLMAFTRDFSVDPYKPRASAVLKHVTATTAAAKNATDFTSAAGDTIGYVSVTVDQYSKPFVVSNTDLMKGLRMDNLIEINAAGLADAIIDVALAPVTVANYETTGGQTSLVSAGAAFGFTELATLWGQLKKSPIKNVLLDGEYLARIINTPTWYQTAGVQPGGGWKAFGWDYIALNTRWTAADTNVRGFACNPQAVACVAGLPILPPEGVPGNTLQVSTATVPDIGLTIANYAWFDLTSRSYYQSFDLMFGASAADKTAGIVIKSA